MKISSNNPTKISFKTMWSQFFTFAWGGKKKRIVKFFFVVVLKSSNLQITSPILGSLIENASDHQFFVDPSFVMFIRPTVHLLIGLIADEFLISLGVSFHNPAYMVYHNEPSDQHSRTAYHEGWKTHSALLICGKTFIHTLIIIFLK